MDEGGKSEENIEKEQKHDAEKEKIDEIKPLRAFLLVFSRAARRFAKASSCSPIEGFSSFRFPWTISSTLKR